MPKRKPRLVETVAFDNVPCFRGHAIILAECRRHGWKGRLNSADRRQGVAEKYGRMSQARLYAGWVARKAGFNPANPPGRSSHELRSDGVAYKGPVGRPLAWWQLGLDLSDSETFIRVASSRGYSFRRPYSSASERHHVNLRKSPTRQLRNKGH